MVWGQTMAMCINLGSTIHVNYPGDHVLHNFLVQLVENVRRNGLDDIGIWQVLPKWTVHRLDPCSMAVMSKSC
jgi:hypothetical protein